MYVKKADTTIVRNTDNGAFVVNVVSGENCSINETGHIFMKYLDTFAQEISSIAEKILPLFEKITKEELAKDLLSFYHIMSESNYVVLAEEKNKIENFPLDSLHLEITNACNERCIHCFIPNKSKSRATQMSFVQFRNIIDEFHAMGGHNITLSGGEPLMHDSILDMLQYCNSKDLKVNLFSNLLLLNETHINELKKINVGFIQVSLYSLNPNIHDQITKCKGSLEKTLISIKTLITSGFEVQLAVPIMSHNKDCITDLLEYAEYNKIAIRFTTEIIPKLDGDDSFSKNYSISKQQNHHLVCSIIQKTHNRDKLNSLLGITTKSSDFYSSPTNFLKSSFCPAGINSCSISSDGNIYPCPSWHRHCLGNVFREPLSDVWKNSPTLKWIRDINKYEAFKQCLECNLLDYCKRCLATNERANMGEIFKVNLDDCEDANFLKCQLQNIS